MGKPRATETRTEHRWPAVVAIIVAVTIYSVLPDTNRILPEWVFPVLGVVLLIPLVALNPRRLNRETTWSRWASIGFSVLLTLVNQVSIGLTIEQLVDGKAHGSTVLLTALQVWVTNVVAFALIYWELDRGGPVARRIEGMRDDASQDFRFPQEDGSPGGGGFHAGYIDYLYFSLTNMMAFSPTDVMPLTPRAKALMGYQALAGFVLLALVISRAVNILT